MSEKSLLNKGCFSWALRVEHKATGEMKTACVWDGQEAKHLGEYGSGLRLWRTFKARQLDLMWYVWQEALENYLKVKIKRVIYKKSGSWQGWGVVGGRGKVARTSFPVAFVSSKGTSVRLTPLTSLPPLHTPPLGRSDLWVGLGEEPGIYNSAFLTGSTNSGLHLQI